MKSSRRLPRRIQLTKVEAGLMLAEAMWKADHMTWPEDRVAWARIAKKVEKTFAVARRTGARR